MDVFCKRVKKLVSDEGCVMRIKQSIDIKTLKKCRDCVMANFDRADIVNIKLAAIDEQNIVALQKHYARNKRNIDGLKLPPSRVCHTCGQPTNGWECNVCRDERRKKGV